MLPPRSRSTPTLMRPLSRKANRGAFGPARMGEVSHDAKATRDSSPAHARVPGRARRGTPFIGEGLPFDAATMSSPFDRDEPNAGRRRPEYPQLALQRQHGQQRRVQRPPDAPAADVPAGRRRWYRPTSGTP